MSDAGINAVRPTRVHNSFVITVGIDESRCMAGVTFFGKGMGKEALREAMHNQLNEVLFEGQGVLAKSWMSMGNGALPLNLFMMSRLDAALPPVDDIARARNYFRQLHDCGGQKIQATQKFYPHLLQLEELLARVDRCLLND